MPFDGSGNYSLPPAPAFPAVTNTTISSTYFNQTLNDVANALQLCMTRDGQGGPTATIYNWKNKSLSSVNSLSCQALTCLGSGSFAGTISVAGAATGITPTYGDNSTAFATTQFVQQALSGYTPSFANVTFTGVCVAPTATTGTNTTQIATCAFVNASITAGYNSPTLTGTPLTPTAAFGTNSTQIASTAYVIAAKAPTTQTVTSSATVTPTFAQDLVVVNSQAVNLTLANPTGTAIDGWGIVIRVQDNGTARTIVYGSQYRGIGLTLPTTTVAGKVLYLGMMWNANVSFWDVLSALEQ